MNGQDLDIQSFRTVKLATQVAEINEHLVTIISKLGGQDGNEGGGSCDDAISKIQAKLDSIDSRLVEIEQWKKTIKLEEFEEFTEFIPQLKLLSYLFFKHYDPENLPSKTNSPGGIFLEKVYRQMTDRDLVKAVQDLPDPLTNKPKGEEIKWIEKEILKLQWDDTSHDVDKTDKKSQEQAQAFENFLTELRNFKARRWLAG